MNYYLFQLYFENVQCENEFVRHGYSTKM